MKTLILFQIFAAAHCWAGPASARDENAIRSIIAQMNENWNQHDAGRRLLGMA